MAGPNEVRLSDIESRFICKAGGKRGADMRPDFVRRGETRPATEAKRRQACEGLHEFELKRSLVASLTCGRIFQENRLEESLAKHRRLPCLPERAVAEEIQEAGGGLVAGRDCRLS